MLLVSKGRVLYSSGSSLFDAGICPKYDTHGCPYSEADVWIPEPFHAEVPTDWWDKEADKSLLIGVFKHGKGCLCWTPA